MISGAAVIRMPGAELLWARLHGVPTNRMLHGEDGAGLSVVKSDASSFRGDVRVFANGLGQSRLPYGGIHTALGLLPVLIHPAPSDVLVIGLGSGNTVFGAAARREVEQLIAVEIIGAQRETLEDLFARHPNAGLEAVLRDPRIAHHTGDGRAFLLQSPRLYDVIEADALRPTSAYAGNLYSQEYFALVSRRLKPDGLAVTWAPTERIRRTFLSVFPHVLALGDILVGSNTVIPFDHDALTARAAEVSAHFTTAGIDDYLTILAAHLDAPLVFAPDSHRAPGALNEDLFPRDEFSRRH
jgi:predicted membrane-bound spermidine synthase